MKRMKLFALGMMLCFSLAVMTGCGNDNTENSQDEEHMATENVDMTDNKDNKKNDNKTDNQSKVNDSTTGTGTDNGSNIGTDIVDTVDDVGTGIVDGVTDIGEDLTGNDGNNGAGNNSHVTSTPAAR